MSISWDYGILIIGDLYGFNGILMGYSWDLVGITNQQYDIFNVRNPMP